MNDQAVIDAVVEEIRSVPGRAGDLNRVVSRGTRRRRTRTTAKAAGLITAIVLAFTPLFLQGLATSDVAAGDSTLIHLPGGFDVRVEPGEPVISNGATVFVGALADDSELDTSDLGTEMPFARGDASDLVVPSGTGPFEANAIKASRLVYLGDLGSRQVALHVTDDGALCVYFGNGTDVTGGGVCDLSESPAVGMSADPDVRAVLTWTMLPEEATVVTIDLPTGDSLWQVPVSRTAVFVTADLDGLVTATARAYDSDGAVILETSPSLLPGHERFLAGYEEPDSVEDLPAHERPDS